MSSLARFRSSYGAGPLHLLATLLSFALAAYVVSVLGVSALWDPEVWWQSLLVWFLGAVIAHDLVLFPAYALADRTMLRGLSALPRRSAAGGFLVSPVNYVRVPVLATGLLFLVFFPGIIGQGAASYLRATGQTQDPFLNRWLLLIAVIFALSAACYAAALVLASRKPAATSEQAASADSD